MAVPDRALLDEIIKSARDKDSHLFDLLRYPSFGAGGPVGTMPYETTATTATAAAVHEAESVITPETIKHMKRLAKAGEKAIFEDKYNIEFENDDHAADAFMYKHIKFDDAWLKDAWLQPNEVTITPERVPVKSDRQEFYENQEDAGAF